MPFNAIALWAERKQLFIKERSNRQNQGWQLYQQAAAEGGVTPSAVLREPPRGADGQTARARLRSKQAPGVGGGQHNMTGEAADQNPARSAW